MKAGFLLDLKSCLKQLGINSDQDLMVHSDVIFTAEYEDAVEEKLRIFFSTLRDWVSPSGSLIVPSFSMSYSQGEIYDTKLSPGTVGQAAEYFRSMPEVKRSLDPIYNFCIQTNGPVSFNLDSPASSFGKDSVFDDFYKRDGLIVFFGCSIDRATFVHYVEEKRGVTYRYHKRFSGKTSTPSEVFDSSVLLYVRDLKLNTIPDHAALKDYLEKTGRLQKAKMGRFACYSVKAKDFFDAANELLDKNEYLLIAEGANSYDFANARPV